MLKAMMGTPTTGETDTVEALPVETQVAPTEGNTVGAPAEGKTGATKGAPVGEDEAAKVS